MIRIFGMTVLAAASSAMFICAPLFSQVDVPNGSGVVMAQRQSSELENLARDLASILGPIGILGWYCFYVTSRVLPGKDAQLVEERKQFAAELKSDREAKDKEMQDLYVQLKQERESHAAIVERQMQSILEMVRKCDRTGG